MIAVLKRLKGPFLVLVGALSMAAFEKVVTSSINHEMIVPLLVLVIFLIAVFLLLTVAKLETTTADLCREVGLKVSYFAADEITGRDRLFEESRRIVSEADKSILALNSFAEERPEAGKEGDIQRLHYFRAILNAPPHVQYKRIVQVDEDKDGSKLGKLFDKSYVEHFEAMLDKKSTRKVGLELRIAPPRFPSTFVIVDDEYLIWELMEVDELDMETRPSTSNSNSKKDRFRMRAVVIVRDRTPSKEFISHFRRNFDELDANSKAADRSNL